MMPVMTARRDAPFAAHRALLYQHSPGSQVAHVRCPGHTIHHMRFGYGEFVERVLELAGLTSLRNMEEYETWTPYRV